jgi:uncharacterized protein
MVQKGQFLERATLIPAGKHTLEGLWHRGQNAPAALLIPPLPGDGSMDAAPLNELAFALTRAGHASLRFNFGGVGASQGGSKTIAQLENDARFAMKLLRENAELDEVGAVSYRSGAKVALRLLDGISRLVLVSPPEDLELEELASANAEALFAIGESDPLRAKWSQHASRTGDRLAVIPGADPAWNRGLVQLGSAVVEFFDRP